VRYLGRAPRRGVARVERGAVTLHLLGFSQGTHGVPLGGAGRRRASSLDPLGRHVPPDLDLAGAAERLRGSACCSSSATGPSTSREGAGAPGGALRSTGFLRVRWFEGDTRSTRNC